MNGLATRWPLELYDIAFRVGNVDRRAFSFGAIPGCHRPRLDVVCLEFTAYFCFIERLDPNAEVIEVPAFLRRWRTPGFAKLPIDRHEVDQGAPGAKLNQPDGVLASFDRASEHVAVEAKHAIEVDDTQHKVVDLTDTNHGRGVSSKRLSSAACNGETSSRAGWNKGLRHFIGRGGESKYLA